MRQEFKSTNKSKKRSVRAGQGSKELADLFIRGDIDMFNHNRFNRDIRIIEEVIV